MNETNPTWTDVDPTTFNSSAVSWGAVFAGAAGAAALSLILLMLGFGLGMSSISPWSNAGTTAAAIGVSTILWVSITQIIASGLGGYLSGRLRVKWENVHNDEVYFRDTAHGFLAWAVASIVMAGLLASAAATAVGGAVEAGTATVSALTAGAVAGGAATSNDASSSRDSAIGYFVDGLFRTERPIADPNDAAIKTETTKIFVNDLRAKELPAGDKQYLGRLIARRTGLNQNDAEARVDDTFNRITQTLTNAETAAKQAADKARKAAAYSTLWMFIALLCGAFFASLAATFGGRQRDSVTPV
jgi:hypothetical protein